MRITARVRLGSVALAAAGITFLGGCSTAPAHTATSADGTARATVAASPAPIRSASALPSPWASDSGTAAQRAAAQAALIAYAASWTDVQQLARTSDATNARIGAHLVGAALTDWTQTLASDAKQGIVTQGQLAFSPEVVSVSPADRPTRVEVADCVDMSNWLRRHTKSGTLVDDVPGGRHRAESVLVLGTDGFWRVAQQDHAPAGSC